MIRSFAFAIYSVPGSIFHLIFKWLYPEFQDLFRDTITDFNQNFREGLADTLSCCSIPKCPQLSGLGWVEPRAKNSTQVCSLSIRSLFAWAFLYWLLSDTIQKLDWKKSVCGHPVKRQNHPTQQLNFLCCSACPSSRVFTMSSLCLADLPDSKVSMHFSKHCLTPLLWTMVLWIFHGGSCLPQR